MDFSLTNKVAVVTGASTGAGRGVALALAEHGAKVLVADLQAKAPEGNFDVEASLSTAEVIVARGGAAAFVRCDVTQASDVSHAFGTAVAQFGGVDILVNNAGVHRGGRRLHEMEEADLDACWSVICKGTWLASQAALKTMLAQRRGGSIINIVSTAGLAGHTHQAPYNMAKAAQANLTRCLALEYARDGIRTNAICPTYLKTGMSRGGYENPAFDAFVAASIPLGRWGEIQDVASAAVFLASDVASFINGALLPVDGGEVAGAPAAALWGLA